jgi:hypothetical protein
MNNRLLVFLAANLAALCAVGSARAQLFQSGSDGSFGPINITADATIDVPPDGMIHATTINVVAGRILRFRRNALNTPVVLLATGDVTIAGTIDVSGGRGSSSAPGLAGPGGFDGGSPGSVGLPGGDGQGPGGGKAGTVTADETAAGNGSYGTTSSQGPPAKRGAIYGSALLFPIVGGSGGGGAAGNPGWGGGAGGGAVLIASSTRISLTGTIRSFGGQGLSSAIWNYGSGGAVRLIAPSVSGNGTVDVRGNGGTSNSGLGRARVDALDRSALNISFLPNSTASVGGFMVVFPDPFPRLDIVEAAGRAIALDSGPTQVLLPTGSPASQIITVRARDFGQNVPVRVVLTPDNGPAQTYDAEINNTTANPAEVAVNVTFPVNVLTHVHVWTR